MIPIEVLRIEAAPERRCTTCPTLAAWMIFFKSAPTNPEAFCWDCFNIFMRKMSELDDEAIYAFYERWMRTNRETLKNIAESPPSATPNPLSP